MVDHGNGLTIASVSETKEDSEGSYQLTYGIGIFLSASEDDLIYQHVSRSFRVSKGYGVGLSGKLARCVDDDDSEDYLLCTCEVDLRGEEKSEKDDSYCALMLHDAYHPECPAPFM